MVFYVKGSLKQYVDEKIAQLENTGGTGTGGAGVPKYPLVSDLPTTAQEGDIAVVFETDQIHIFDETGNWKTTGIASGDAATGDGLTRVQADGLYSTLNHSHSEFSPISHNHPDYQTKAQADALYAEKTHTHQNLQDQISALGQGMVFKAELPTFASIPASKVKGDTWVITTDETRSNQRSLYTFNGTDLVYLGTFGVSAGAKIDDSLPNSTTTTYSGSKIEARITEKTSGGFEAKINSYTQDPDLTSISLGTKLLVNNKLFLVGQGPTAPVETATPQFASKTELTSAGYEIEFENQNGTDDVFRAFDNSDTTYGVVMAAQAYASAGKIGLKMPVEKTMGSVEFITNTSWFPSDFAIEYSNDDITWTQIQRWNNEINGGANYATNPTLTYNFPATRAKMFRVVVYARGYQKLEGGSTNRAWFYKLTFKPAVNQSPKELVPIVAERKKTLTQLRLTSNLTMPLADVHYTVMYNQKTNDWENTFDTSNGTFTAPRTGVYQFTQNLYYSGIAAKQIYIQSIRKNGAITPFKQGTAQETISSSGASANPLVLDGFTTQMSLNKGDMVDFTSLVGTTGASINYTRTSATIVEL